MIEELKKAINDYDLVKVVELCKILNIPESDGVAAVAARMRYDINNAN